MSPSINVAQVAGGVTLYDREIVVFRDKVVLRLSNIGQRLMLERQLVRPEGTRLTQVLEVTSESDLYDFATADQYYGNLKVSYQIIAGHAVKAGVGKVDGRDYARSVPEDISDANLIGNIAECTDELALMDIVRIMVGKSGGDQFFYSWVASDAVADDIVDYRYLVGGNVAWLQHYLSRLWYVNDPVLEYAKKFTRPTVSNGLNVYDPSHWFLTVAPKYGLVSHFVSPVHGPGKGWIGILHVLSKKAVDASETLLWGSRLELRALSAELLDWRIEKIRIGATAAFNLDKVDLEVLTLVHGGGSALHVANALGISIKKVYSSVYPGINGKFGTTRIMEAVSVALANGLL